MRVRLSAALTISVLTLAACAVAPPSPSVRPSGSSAKVKAASVTIQGELIAPANVTAGMPLIGQDGSSVVAAGAGNVIAGGAGNYRISALSERPLGGAAIVLADGAGHPVPAVAATATDGKGHFSIVIPGGQLYQLTAKVRTAHGEATLATVVGGDAPGTGPVAINAATTLATRALVTAAGGLEGLDPERFADAVVATAHALETNDPPEWSDAEAVAAAAKALVPSPKPVVRPSGNTAASTDGATAAATPAPTGASGDPAIAPASPTLSTAPTQTTSQDPGAPTPSPVPTATSTTVSTSTPTASPTPIVAYPIAEYANAQLQGQGAWGYWLWVNGTPSPLTFDSASGSWHGTSPRSEDAIFKQIPSLVMDPDGTDGGVALSWNPPATGDLVVTGDASLEVGGQAGVDITLYTRTLEPRHTTLDAAHNPAGLNLSAPVDAGDLVYLVITPATPGPANAVTLNNLVFTLTPTP